MTAVGPTAAPRPGRPSHSCPDPSIARPPRKIRASATYPQGTGSTDAPPNPQTRKKTPHGRFHAGANDGSGAVLLSTRARLTLLYGSLFFCCGAGLIVIVYFLMRYVPQYAFAGSTGTRSTLQTCTSSGPASCIPDGGMAGATVMPTSSITISSEGDVLSTLMWVSALALVGMTILALILGWWIAGRMLAPVQRITTTARRVAAGNLSDRIRLSGHKTDELKELADTFDEMLGRLERSFAAQQRFAANASHELRTPITTSRTLIQVAMANPAVADIGAVGPKLLDQNRHSEQLINALLNLARANQGLDSAAPVDLTQLAGNAVRTVGAEAAQQSIDVRCELGNAVVEGDPDLLSLLLMNLLQNGIRHNIPGGYVQIVVGAHGQDIIVQVSNTGPTVSTDQIELLCEPFQRGTNRTYSRTRGHGLGLSIIHSITTAHGGRMDIHPNPAGGLTVTIAFRPFRSP